MSALVWLGLGTNIGDRMENLRAAEASLSDLVEIRRVSSIYETEPWGYTEQPAFLNLAMQISTDLPPTNLLSALKKLEVRLGREPSFHLGPRLIDIDILFYGDLVYETPQLVIPHPHLTERAFVLVPLAEIAAELVHPVLKRKVIDLLSAVDTSGVRMVQQRVDAA